MSSSSSSTSPSPPCPAAENLAEALSFKSKKKVPSTVTFLHPQPQQQLPPAEPTPPAAGSPNPKSTSADPVRYVTWGPRTVFYAITSPSKPSSSSKNKKKKAKAKKKHPVSGSESQGRDAKDEDEDVRFEKWTFNGSEEVQTTETTEVLGVEEG
ncbi:MAG: hypothetical protein Q9196_003585, partial [Gyalolechia fulgens]